MPAASRFFSAPPESITARDEARFFGQLKTGNGTFKRTEPGRLDLVNGWLVEQLQRARSQPDEVLDIGISSGVTTMELAQVLRRSGMAARLTGTDRAFCARLIEIAPGVRALAEPNGHSLQYELLGVPMRAWYRRLDFIDGLAALRFLAHKLIDKRVAAALRDGRGEQVPLVTPRLHAFPEIELIDDDVTTRNPRFAGRFDLIRAANILNRHYFDRSDLQHAIANVRSYLRGPGAWLLVVRTIGGAAHHGTLFRMDDTGLLEVVARCGRGSEVEAMFLDNQETGRPLERC